MLTDGPQMYAHGPYARAVPEPHRTTDPHPGRPWTIHEGDNRCSLDIYDAEHFDACVTDCPYGLSTELDPPNLERDELWDRLVEHEQNPRPLSQYLMAEYASFVGENGRDPTPEEWFDLADVADRRRVLEGPMIAQLIWHWQTTGENPRVTGKGFMGNEWDALVPPPNAWRAVWRVLKPGAYLMTFAGTRTDDLVTLSLRFAGFRIEDRIAWLQGQGMAKRRRLDLAVDDWLGMKSCRPVTGRARGQGNIPNDRGEWGYKPNADVILTAAATPEAARHVGWDRGLHPRHEPVIVATKPMRGKVAETALRYGTGGMNVDWCRIERGEIRTGNGKNATVAVYGEYAERQAEYVNTSGGYPTNVMLDETAAAELDAMSGPRGGAAPASGPTHEGPSDARTRGRYVGMGDRPTAFHGKVDGASKFFYVAKAATSERDKGLEALDVMTPGERSGREDGSAGINGYAGTRGEARNPGPCVKPIAAMRNLVRLACPPGAWDPDESRRPRVLDPYMGTGSTGVACMVEGVRFVGCELGATYAVVARQRLQHAYALPHEPAPASSADGEGATEGATASPPPRAARGGQSSLF